MDNVFKGVVGALCAYESVAIASNGRIPTITSVVHRYPIVGAFVLAGLSHHFQKKATD